ncbi:hypothetical protein [Agromyces sp. NPDC058104]|uniref:hypothetical protein n=1 Tax=Agromyces sp. NPDC058104 TaxID=3346342 RepID=UPI0036DF46BF
MRWEDPEPRHNERHDWADAADQLRARPGEWALIGTDVKMSAVNSLTNGTKKFPKGEFQFTVRGTTPRGQGEHRAAKVYARYIGEDSRDDG